MTDLGGVLPVLSTPFTADDHIDATVLAREIDWVLGAGADGVTVAMVSEILRLDADERRALGAATVDAVAGRGHVVLSVGAESTTQSIAFARHAVAAGATALMANPPLNSSPDADGLRDHFRAIADATSTIPLVIQDASGYVGTPIPTDVLSDLLGEYGEQKIQFKPEAEPLGPRLTSLLDATGGRARVFEGTGGRALLESHRRGVVGTMPGPDVTWAIVSLWRALEDADHDRAYLLQEALTPLLGLVSSLDSYVALEKHLLHVQGVFENTNQRGPVDFQLDDVTRAEVAVLFERLRARVDALTTEAAR